MSVDAPPRTLADIAAEREAEWQAKRDDLAWMAENGENIHGAAKRMGWSVRTLSSWCTTHGASEQWAALRANAPHLGL